MPENKGKIDETRTVIESPDNMRFTSRNDYVFKKLLFKPMTKRSGKN